MKYIVEKLHGQGLWLFAGEFNNTMAMATALKLSPAKTRNAVDTMLKRQWNRMGEYRVYIRTEE